jgi:hypothetical protein
VISAPHSDDAQAEYKVFTRHTVENKQKAFESDDGDAGEANEL